MRLSRGGWGAVKVLHAAVGAAALALSAIAGLYGGWRWWRGEPSAWFWRLLRAAQAALLIEVAIGGILVAIGRHVSNLHLIYGLVPVAVSFVAEQLRIAAAQMVLDARGFQSAREVGRLPREQQQEIVLAILSREMGVMVLALLVNAVLLARAAGTG